MSDLVQRVTGDMNFFQKILGKLPGFKGYVERTNRRSADKLLREAIASRFEEQWQRISGIQRELIGEKDLKTSGKLEAPALKLRQFIDRVRTASYGYAGFFDAVKINQEELDQVYQFDLALLGLVDEVTRAIDNVEASIGTDGMKAAIRNLTSLSQKCVDTYNKRQEALIGEISTSAPQQPAP